MTTQPATAHAPNPEGSDPAARRAVGPAPAAVEPSAADPAPAGLAPTEPAPEEPAPVALAPVELGALLSAEAMGLAADAAEPVAPERLRPDWKVLEGYTPYDATLAGMEAQVAAIRAGTAAEAVWLVEHPPTYTAGTSARPEDLHDARFPTFNAGRGGQWTYHGPGQRTAYVMLDLTRPHGTVAARDVRSFVHGLEEWMIRALDRFNVRGERRDGRVGIWVADPKRGGESKIGAIGVRVTRWVSWHGIALNVDPDLSHFGGIVPCGISEHGVTSLHDLGILATMEEADAALMAAWKEIFG